MTLLEYLEAVTEAQTTEELWTLHCEAMARYGFDRVMYGFTRYLTQSSVGDPQDIVLLTNHRAEYARHFMENGLYFNAPMVNWARHNEGAISWDVIAQMDKAGVLTEAERKVLEFNQQMGVTAGYTISFASMSARSKGAIALTAQSGVAQADVDAIWEKHGRHIALMNNVAHLKIISLPFPGPRNLTKRQREVLEWVSDGKTMQDIAKLMGLTAATVEKHLRLAREALDVETTAQAVLKAAFQNQMFVIEP
ncbi:MAG: LuxR family transcriptional regulator [Pseudomonadota bacterium]